jgi:hypothetical protein
VTVVVAACAAVGIAKAATIATTNVVCRSFVVTAEIMPAASDSA